MQKRLLALTLVATGFSPAPALAHCPLCTIGVVAVGLGAYQLGISTFSVGVVVGAAALALGLWLARLARKQYVPRQRPLIALIIFATTLLPVAPFLPGARGLYIPFVGQYGYTLVVPNVFIGALLGAILVLFAPTVSAVVARARRGKRVPFQGVAAVVVLVALALALVELII